jgi:chloramphenicol 3-O phosphotransferase
MRGMRHAVAAMTAQGNDLIVDEVILDARDAQEYSELLRPYDLFLVGVIAPFDVLEAREHARDDREIGLARGQYGLVHREIAYDLEVDTSAKSPAECAQMICDAFGL